VLGRPDVATAIATLARSPPREKRRCADWSQGQSLLVLRDMDPIRSASGRNQGKVGVGAPASPPLGRCRADRAPGKRAFVHEVPPDEYLVAGEYRGSIKALICNQELRRYCTTLTDQLRAPFRFDLAWGSTQEGGRGARQRVANRGVERGAAARTRQPLRRCYKGM
jgi:hypothetical protein